MVSAKGSERLVSSVLSLSPVTLVFFSGSAKDLIGTHFMDGMNELVIAYILQGVLKALDYIHHMGYVHRCVPSYLPFTDGSRVQNQGSGVWAYHLGDSH